MVIRARSVPIAALVAGTVLWGTLPTTVLAAASEPPGEGSGTDSPPGRPRIVLDRLDFPSGGPDHGRYKALLKKILARETRRAIWGAGTGSTITYRYSVQRFTVTRLDGVVRVHCSALGALPRGKTAKGNLTFSGDPREEPEVVRRVLEIVARGVVTRLAELERDRRGGFKRPRPSTE